MEKRKRYFAEIKGQEAKFDIKVICKIKLQFDGYHHSRRPLNGINPSIMSTEEIDLIFFEPQETPFREWCVATSALNVTL